MVGLPASPNSYAPRLSWRERLRLTNTPVPFGGPLVGSWVLLLVPAVAGTILGIRGWPTVGLMLPGTCTQLYLGYKAGLERGYIPCKHSGVEIAVECIAGLIALGATPRDYYLIIVIGVILHDGVSLWRLHAAPPQDTAELCS